jgi:hypothetical protein
VEYITNNNINNITISGTQEALKLALSKLNHFNKSKNDFLPSDVKDVIINDNSVIVNLTNGKKGVSTQSPEDHFDPFVGFCIAYYKAKNIKVFRLKEALDGCDSAARKKGYKQAILKNYDEDKK